MFRRRVEPELLELNSGRKRGFRGEDDIVEVAGGGQTHADAHGVRGIPCEAEVLYVVRKLGVLPCCFSTIMSVAKWSGKCQH